MEITAVVPKQLRKFEIPGRVALANGGGLPKINITTGASTAEVYLHGAQVTGFRKNGEPPLLFLSRRSRFVPARQFAAACRFAFRGSAGAKAA